MYESKNHAKYSLVVHLVFVVKYRHPLLIILSKEVKKLIISACKKYSYNLITCESHIDYVHILLSYSPTDSISSIVKNLKQYTTYHLRKTENGLLFKYIYGSRRFWSRGYFACSIGKGASYDTIFKYIENQG